MAEQLAALAQRLDVHDGRLEKLEGRADQSDDRHDQTARQRLEFESVMSARLDQQDETLREVVARLKQQDANQLEQLRFIKEIHGFAKETRNIAVSEAEHDQAVSAKVDRAVAGHG